MGLDAVDAHELHNTAIGLEMAVVVTQLIMKYRGDRKAAQAVASHALEKANGKAPPIWMTALKKVQQDLAHEANEEQRQANVVEDGHPPLTTCLLRQPGCWRTATVSVTCQITSPTPTGDRCSKRWPALGARIGYKSRLREWPSCFECVRDTA